MSVIFFVYDYRPDKLITFSDGTTISNSCIILNPSDSTMTIAPKGNDDDGSINYFNIFLRDGKLFGPQSSLYEFFI
jgi:hypothetical protein